MLQVLCLCFQDVCVRNEAATCVVDQYTDKQHKPTSRADKSGANKPAKSTSTIISICKDRRTSTNKRGSGANGSMSRSGSDYAICDMDLSRISDQGDQPTHDTDSTAEVDGSRSADTVDLTGQAYDPAAAHYTTSITSVTSNRMHSGGRPMEDSGFAHDGYYDETFPDGGYFINSRNDDQSASQHWGSTYAQPLTLPVDVNSIAGYHDANGMMAYHDHDATAYQDINYHVDVPAMMPWPQQPMPPGQMYCWLVQQMSANPYLWQIAPPALHNFLIEPASSSDPSATAHWAQWLMANLQY